MELPTKDVQKARKPREPKDAKEPRPPKEGGEGKSPQEGKPPREPRAPKAPKAEGAEGGESQSPRKRPPRAPRNDEWKGELERTMTVDTKIPAFPKDEELLKRPDGAAHKASLEKVTKKIDKLFAEMEEIRKQERDLREEIFAKNNAEYVELRKLGEARKALAAKLDGSKKAKEEIKAQVAVLEDKKSKLEKKGVNGRVLSKEKLEELIAEKEREHRNKLKTAAEEKKFLDEVSKLKESMPLVSEINKVQVQIDALYKRQKEINATNKPILQELDALRAKADVLRSKLGLDDKKKEEGEAKAEGEKKEKPKRELTQEEKDLAAKRQALFEQANKLKEQRSEMYTRYQKDNDAYFAQQDEIYKIKFMEGLKKKLKAIEAQKKREANRAAYEAEELEAAKAKAAAKFTEDLEICDGLLSELEQIRFREKINASAGAFGLPADAKAEHKVDDKLLKEANLVVMKSKKDESDAVQPGRKFGKKGKKTEAVAATEAPKLDIAAATLSSLAKLGIAAPKSLDDLEATADAIKAKKADFTSQKEAALANAEAAYKANVGKEQTGEETLTEEKPKEAEEAAPKPAEKKREVKIDETSFPALA